MSPRLMDPKKKIGLLRKAVADAYGEDRTWMTAGGRAEELIREARTNQQLLLADAGRRATIDAAIKEIEGLCLLAEVLLRRGGGS